MRVSQAGAGILAAVLTAGAAVAASGSSTASAAAPAPPVPAGEAAPEATREPRVERRIAEDEHVRVEELRVRGESRQITVRPKLPGARPYEIVPATGATDPSQRGRRAPGSSQWRLWDF